MTLTASTTVGFVEIGYLQFYPIDSTGKTFQWRVVGRDNGTRLGVIKWFGRWRQYCFFPEPDTVFNRGCLRDIVNFIEGVKNERKA